MNLCRNSFSLFAASVLSAGSCFGGLLHPGLNSGDQLNIDVSYSAPIGVFNTNLNSSTGSALFKLDADTTGSYVDDLVTFCFEIGETVISGKEYQTHYFEGDALTTSDSVLTGNSLLWMKTLFTSSHFLGSKASDWTGKLEEYFAFQLAVWEITYDGGSLTPTLSLAPTDGNFYVNGTTSTATANALTKANGILTDVLGAGIADDTSGLVGFIDTDDDSNPNKDWFQNQISYVPEPSVLGLQALFIAAMFLRRKRS